MPLAALVGAGAIAVILTSGPLSGTADGRGDVIVGRASVVDGDTLQIGSTRIRLHGIDAPESGQSCTVREARVPCGRVATMALADKISGRSVACEAKTRDWYNRIVAVCRSGDENPNAWMVSHGWAMADHLGRRFRRTLGLAASAAALDVDAAGEAKDRQPMQAARAAVAKIRRRPGSATTRSRSWRARSVR